MTTWPAPSEVEGLHELLTSVHDLAAFAWTLLRAVAVLLSRVVSLPEWWLFFLG